MDTYITAFCANEEEKKYETHERLSNYLSEKYNDQNITIDYLVGDRINIDGGRRGKTDNYIYEIKKREHWFGKDGTHVLRLWMRVIQDRNDGYYI